MLIDSHCHLDLLLDKGFNIETLLLEAKNQHVKLVQTICTNIEQFDQILSITETYDNVFCSVGLHPLSATEDNMKSAEIIANLTQNNKVIGIGETGLDFFYETKLESIEIQKRSFINHIKAAQMTGLPLIIHTRNADYDTVKILQDEYKKKQFAAVIHCFTATQWLAEACLDIGIYISASGIITFKKSEEICSIFKDIPLNRILIETDSPYLAPVPLRGKVNQPAYIKHIAQRLAELKCSTFEEICNITTNNFITLFDKVKNVIL